MRKIAIINATEGNNQAFIEFAQPSSKQPSSRFVNQAPADDTQTPGD